MAEVSISQSRGCLANNLVRVEWDKGCWAIQWPQYQAHLAEAATAIALDNKVKTLALADWQCKLEAVKLNDALGESAALSAIFTRDDLEVTVVARIVPTQSSVMFTAQVRNLGNASITTTDFRALHEGTRLDLGELAEGKEAVAIYVDSGSQGGTHIARLVDAQTCYGIRAAYNPVSDLGFVCAYTSFAHDNSVTLAPVGRSLRLEVRTFTGAGIPPGATHSYDRLLIGCRRSPCEALESYADVVKAVNDPPIPEEIPIGWISWYGYRLEMTEDIVLQNAEVLARHFRKYGLKVVQLDHGWQYQDICGV